MSYGNTPDPYGAQPQQGYPQQPGGFPGQPGGLPGQPGGYGAGGYQFGAPALSPEVAPLPGASVGDAVKRFFQRYAQFRGYASPSEFWWVLLFLLILETVAYLLILAPLLGALIAAAPSDPAAMESGAVEPAAAIGGVGFMLMMFIFSIIGLALFLPSLALSVRRLHDTGKSGLWLLLCFVPLGGIILLVFWCMPSRPDLYRPEWS